jgi:putative endonuclease
MDFFYVYILESVNNSEIKYYGFTENLRQRLQEHNSGKSSHTFKNRPWRIKTAIAFTNMTQALAFEKYIKSHSGRAFASKHLF